NFINGLVFSQDGKTLFTGEGFGCIKSYDVATGKEIGPALQAPSLVYELALSPNGKLLAYGKDYSVHLHDLSTGRDCDLGLPDDQSFPTIAFSSDSRRVAAVSSMNQVCLWDVASEKLLRRLGSPSPQSK